ncbi:homoserine dehydrogenase [Rhodococcus sp. WS4]|nr:homoserine dehydrogenase [Rhodococcus sp. WS4]
MNARPLPVPIVVIGYGPVAQSYTAVLHARRAEFRDRYHVDPYVVAVRGRHRQAIVSPGDKPPARELWAERTPLEDLLHESSPRVVAQAVPSDPGGAAEALADGLTAIEHDAHLVTATKSPLLSGWAQLHNAAVRKGRGVRISGATGAALPAGDVARTALRGFDVREVRGCLNGTASFVLDRLGEGTTLADAVAVAQSRGIAEADPAADLSGADTATKTRLLAGLLWGWDVSACDVETEPITGDTAARAAEADARGAVLRQVGSASSDAPGRVVVTLREFPRSEPPFGALAGPEKAVTFGCGEAGDITVSGGRSSPLGAALAMVKDTLSLATDPVNGLG